MEAQGGCGISVLPVEVLSKVLQHVDLSDRLLSCSLVCSLWRKAAAMSVTDIHVPKCKRGHAASLSVWLRAHAAQARLASISISMASNRLFLPLQHLASLRTLRLDNARVMAADTAEAVAGPQSDRQEFLTPALSGLTRLELLSCKVWLKGLHNLTGLQHLALQLPKYYSGQDPHSPGMRMQRRNLRRLRDDMIHLKHLTALHLSDMPAVYPAGGAAVLPIGALTRLQELELKLTSTSQLGFTERSFPNLPSTLTRLSFAIDSTPGQPGNDPDFHFGPTTTPGMCKLTALQELELSGCLKRRYLVHVGMLTALLALRKLALGGAIELTAAMGEPTLSALTVLTKSSLVLTGRLCSSHSIPASDIPRHHRFTGPAQAYNIFPADRHLPSLQSLKLDVLWLEDAEVTYRVIICCPGLQKLEIFSGGEHDIADVASGRWAASLKSLTGLSHLTSLHMLTIDVTMSREVYRAIASLTGLRELCLEALVASELWAAVQLTACQQLTHLQFGVSVADSEGDLSVYATNKAPAGSPPNAWRQIPALILQSATDNFDAFETDKAALQPLLRAAAQASSHALQRESHLEQRVEGLEQQVAECMQHVAQSNQQVAQLHASMAAVLQHLQLPGASSRGAS